MANEFDQARPPIGRPVRMKSTIVALTAVLLNGCTHVMVAHEENKVTVTATAPEILFDSSKIAERVHKVAIEVCGKDGNWEKNVIWAARIREALKNSLDNRGHWLEWIPINTYRTTVECKKNAKAVGGR